MRRVPAGFSKAAHLLCYVKLLFQRNNFKGRGVRSLAEGLVAAKVAQGLRLPAGRRAPALGPGYPGLLEPKSAKQMDRPRFG